MSRLGVESPTTRLIANVCSRPSAAVAGASRLHRRRSRLEPNTRGMDKSCRRRADAISADIDRNSRPTSIGMGGRDHGGSPAEFIGMPNLERAFAAEPGEQMDDSATDVAGRGRER